MYAYIRGMVDQVAADRAVLEAAGVGYELLCSGATLKRLATGPAVYAPVPGRGRYGALRVL